MDRQESSRLERKSRCSFAFYLSGSVTLKASLYRRCWIAAICWNLPSSIAFGAHILWSIRRIIKFAKDSGCRLFRFCGGGASEPSANSRYYFRQKFRVISVHYRLHTYSKNKEGRS